MMERRLNPRISTQTGVNLYFNGHGRINAQLRDFSQGGVAVILNEDADAPEKNDVIFMLAENMDIAYPMKVIHCHARNWVLGFIE